MSRCRISSAQQGSLPLALLVAIIVAGIAVVLVARVGTSQRQVQFDQSYHGALPVAEAGLEQAKFLLNSGEELESQVSGLKPASDFIDGERTVVQNGEIDGRTYEWFLVRRDSGWEANSTAVDARGRTEVDRHLVGEIQEQPLVTVAAFADRLFAFTGSNTADSYSSRTGQWCTRQGFVASNNDVFFRSNSDPGVCSAQRPTGRSVDRVFLYNWDEDQVEGRSDEYPGGERCGTRTGPANDPSISVEHVNCRDASHGGFQYQSPALIQEKITPTVDGAKDFIEDALTECTEKGIELKDFSVAEQDSQVLEPASSDDGWLPFDSIDTVNFNLNGNFYCYDNLFLDADTTISSDASIDKPVIIFVDGTLQVAAGNNAQQSVSVGCGASGCTPGDPATTPEAGRLWIFVRADEVAVRAQSDFAGVIWAPQSVCGPAGPGQGGASGAQTDFYGSLICLEIAPGQGGWRFHFDDALGRVGDGKFVQTGWREQARANE